MHNLMTGQCCECMRRNGLNFILTGRSAALHGAAVALDRLGSVSFNIQKLFRKSYSFKGFLLTTIKFTLV